MSKRAKQEAANEHKQPQPTGCQGPTERGTCPQKIVDDGLCYYHKKLKARLLEPVPDPVENRPALTR
ncbi:MAG: hypothetical protein WAQ25_00380 [Candidatus Saccharimonas sp.]